MDDGDGDEDDDEPVPPPAGFDKPTSWDAITKAWSSAPATPTMRQVAGPSDREAVAKTLGIASLPPSYLAYLARFEPLGRLWLRYERDDYPTDLIISRPEDLERNRNTFIQLLETFAEIDDQMRARAKDLRGLLPFGRDTSRTDICWDPAQTNPDGEMAICFINHEFDSRIELGPDLKEVVKYYKPGS